MSRISAGVIDVSQGLFGYPWQAKEPSYILSLRQKSSVVIGWQEIIGGHRSNWWSL